MPPGAVASRAVCTSRWVNRHSPVSVPAVRMDDARAEELGRRVTRAAWQISEGLGATTAAVETAVERAGGR